MNANELAKTIYLGDRACKAFYVDGWNERIWIQVDVISRIRSASGKWEFYSDEDIVDGRLVLDKVESLKLEPPGLIPNDQIDGIEISSESDGVGKILFRMKVVSAGKNIKPSQMTIEIKAGDFYLEDPKNPGVAIRS